MVRGPRVVAAGCVDRGGARGFNATLYVKVSTDCVAAARARCQTNFAGSMAASGSGCFHSALAQTVICSNGAQKAAPSEPVCQRNTAAETSASIGCERVCVCFFHGRSCEMRRRTKLSCFHCRLPSDAKLEGFAEMRADLASASLQSVVSASG